MKSLAAKVRGPWLRASTTLAAAPPTAGAAASAGTNALEDSLEGMEASAESATGKDRRLSDTAYAIGAGSDNEAEESDCRMLEPERLQTLTQYIHQFSGMLVGWLVGWDQCR